MDNRRTRLTRQLIKNALVELMQARAPEKLTVKEVCALADVNRSTFYDHYADLFAVLEEIEQDFLRQVPLDYASGQIALQDLSAFVRYVSDNRALYSALRQRQTALCQTLTRTVWERYLCEARLHPAIASGLSETAILYVISGSLSLMDAWVSGGLLLPAEELARLLMRYALNVLSLPG